MTLEPNDFRQRLFNAQPMNPELHDTYRRELDSILYQTHTARSRLPGITLLLICVGVVVGEIWALSFYRNQGPVFYIPAITMLLVCFAAALWVGRDLLRGKSVRKDALKVADMFYGAASILMVVQLFHGLQAPSNPASTFNTLFLFVFLFICAAWSFSARITASELAAREQTLRLEYRLADLAERIPK